MFLIGTLSGGGAERVVSNLSQSLPDNVEKEIVLFGKNSKIDYPYSGNINYLDQADHRSAFQKLLISFKRIRKLRKIKKEYPSLLIISFLEYPNLLNMLSGYRKKSIVSVRNYMSTKHKKGIVGMFWNFTIKHFYKNARKITVVSMQMKKDLIENYNLPEEKIKVIYNSYPLQNIKKMAKEKILLNEQKIFNKPTIITAGRLNYQKGHVHLINAFKKIKDVIPDAQLVLLGKGSLEESLRMKAKKLEIEKSVHFLGFQQNPFKYIARSKVFVMPSYFEGFPNALAEAMACEVPVISTDCLSGPRELLAPNEIDGVIDYKVNKKRYGFLVPAFDDQNKKDVEGSISKLTIELIENMELNSYYSNKSKKRIEDFDIKKIINEWQYIIDETN